MFSIFQLCTSTTMFHHAEHVSSVIKYHAVGPTSIPSITHLHQHLHTSAFPTAMLHHAVRKSLHGILHFPAKVTLQYLPAYENPQISREFSTIASKLKKYTSTFQVPLLEVKSNIKNAGIPV